MEMRVRRARSPGGSAIFQRDPSVVFRARAVGIDLLNTAAG